MILSCLCFSFNSFYMRVSHLKLYYFHLIVDMWRWWSVFFLQEKELSAAAEKLAECQETIFLLGKQLRALRPQTDTMGSPWIERSPKRQSLSEEPTTSGMSLHDTDMDELDTATSVKTNSESPMDLYNTLYSPSDSEVNNPLKSPISSKHPKHRPTKSSSSSSSGGPTPEKQSRGFSRFFSSKGKISN